MSQDIKVGFIGLGEMGVQMASNLQRYLASQSSQLTVWNRSADKAEPVKALGAHVASSIEELFSRSNVIFSCLANDAAVESVYEELYALARKVDHPVTFIDSSTVYPSVPKKLSHDLAEISPKHTFLQCPVFGRPPAAAAAQLVWTTDVSRASSFKLLGNFFVVGTVELLAEGLNLAEKVDIDQDAVLDFIRTVFSAPPWIGYSQIMAEGNRSKAGGFNVDLGLKDINHMRKLASESGAYLPTADLAQKHLKAVQDKGLGHQDWTSIIDTIRETEPQTPPKQQ
ncbi:hypothetical protein BGW38_008366 [Lunasporangiospora selenospora]|uniref:3-hydroxyisobutyrate dehydrogenase n=1 Tax=Lunasporangiospora selenospora TaxID=979761 RepID=A0A9P6G004_9FUNG|nr:hypothetical protein BGW38_008366 [Lunasporangiospora selenospora]